MFCRVLVLCLVVFNLCAAYLKLDYNDQAEQIYTCEIDGLVDQNVHQLHGTLVNCQSPPMECSIDSDEYLVKSRTNVECRVPSNGLFYHDDKACSFRFYYRRSYCFYVSRCYSLTMSCQSVATPTVLFYILLFCVALVVILFFSLIIYCIYECCWRTTDLNIPKQDKKIERVLRRSQKLREKQTAYAPVHCETAF
ncbi:unnamed protein product [Caenorhabditis sp. 36 PRJEB53466]|nr:unnamed protein product [Caenorhabditis sp. 36 PRJEB53466]